MILGKDFTFYFSEYFLLKFYFTHFLFIHLKKIKYNIDFNEKSSLVSVESTQMYYFQTHTPKTDCSLG